MTGGRYTILNIPLEDEKELIAFYDRLKKLKVSFSELPDLNLGDGYTQIAYNPDDVESVRLVIDYYKKKFRQGAKEMDLDAMEKKIHSMPKDVKGAEVEKTITAGMIQSAVKNEMKREAEERKAWFAEKL